MNNEFPYTIIAEYNCHRDAEESIIKLIKAGFNMKCFTLVGRDYYSQESVLGFYNIIHRVKKYGIIWAINGAVFSMFFSLSYLLFEGFYNILVVPGLLVYMIMVWALLFGIAGSIWGIFCSIGKPNNSRLRYKLIFKAETYLLVGRASKQEISKMHDALYTSEKIQLKIYR